MTAKYWIAKYIDDPFRNEPRNIGVVTEKDGTYVARFIGERDDGQFDARHIGSKFRYAQVYTQWRSYWREQIAEGNTESLLSPSANFYVSEGGSVADTGNDTPEQVCQFLYSMLVSSGGAMEAYGWNRDEETEVELEAELSIAFEDLHVLASSDTLLAKYPIRARQAIPGQHVSHTPSFSQQNGSLYLFEHIDFSTRNVNKTKERAGWMAYMFSDIKDADKKAEAFSIIRPSSNNASDTIEYARSVLVGESKIVNWSDIAERNSFLEERKRVAKTV